MTLRTLADRVRSVAYPYAPVHMESTVKVEVAMYDDNGQRIMYELDVRDVHFDRLTGNILIRTKEPTP